ncbi:MAG: hypothetical protein JW748_05255 [Anaerolineales bacterium]|nr:hypothetical protein [Anaerolineales bacterium]
MKIKIRLPLILLLLILLAGCGTLKINVDFRNTPVSGVAEIPSGLPESSVAALVSTPTASPTAGESAATPERAAPTPETVHPVALAAGRNFTCAVMSNGGVRCWGDNEHGQLGNGLRVNTNHPVNVIGLTDVKAVTTGWAHVCALTAGGGVKCWGYNANGELGNGKNVDSNKPVDVQGLASGVVAIDSGDDHTCAVMSSGGLKCWGINTYGQLGDWTKDARSVPVDSPWFGGGVADVQAGWGHTCVRTTAGWAKCWGNNQYGQLGFGKLTDIHLPAEDVVDLSAKILDVTADGSQTCALIAGGGAYCWGNNRYGQLGDGTTQKQYAPVAVAGLSTGVIRLEAGWNHTCAVVSGGELRCWGWNYFGQLGEGTTLNRSTPARVQYLTDGAMDVALGWGHTCVLTGLDAVKCWGSNSSGQLGDGTWTDSKIPLTVVDLIFEAPLTKTPKPTQTATRAPTVVASRVFVSLSAGLNHTCGVTSSGGVMCWGDNSFGELGDGTKTNRTVPVDVVGLPDVAIAVAAGGEHTCALTASGEVSCWGKNEFGQLGEGTTSDSRIPVMVKGLPAGMRGVDAGYNHTCALTSTEQVMCWGGNLAAQLGDGTRTNSSVPKQATGLNGVEVSFIATGDLYTCVLTKAGGVKCWGESSAGQLGSRPFNKDGYPPEDVFGLSGGVAAISTGASRTCAIIRDAGVKCWGFYFLGDGTGRSSREPVDVANLSGGAVDIGVGADQTCALISGGGAQCWGFNPGGGVDLFPVSVVGVHGPWKAIAAGSHHTCVLSVDGRAKCWGRNWYGQLGDGTTINRDTPVDLATAPPWK